MRKPYVDFLDRFDGGGAGQTGNSFQGGGLLSALANIFANPYGSEDRARRAQRRQALGLLDTAAAPAQAKVKPGAPFAPRRAPPRGDITMSVLPPAALPMNTFADSGKNLPFVIAHEFPDIAGGDYWSTEDSLLADTTRGLQPYTMPIPAHLTGPKMGTLPPAPSPLGALDEIKTTMRSNAPGVQPSYQSVTNLNDSMPMLADPSGVQPAMPYNDSPVPIQTDMPTAARHTPPSNFTDADYVMMAAQNPAFEAWLMGQPGGLSLPDQAKRFLNLQLINQARQ